MLIDLLSDMIEKAKKGFPFAFRVSVRIFAFGGLISYLRFVAKESGAEQYAVVCCSVVAMFLILCLLGSELDGRPE